MMKTMICFALVFILLAADASFAAIVTLTRGPSPSSVFTDDLIQSGLGSRDGHIQSFAGGFTATVDTVADTGSIVSAAFGVAVGGGGTFTQTITTITPPTNFPDLPIITTATHTESVSVDPVNLAPELLSSTGGPISYLKGTTYQFPTTLTVRFPDSFTVSGTYEFQSPEETFTVPFNVLYTPIGATEIGDSPTFVDVGLNFPNTAGVSSDLSIFRRYRPASRIIFSGAIAGRPFNVAFRDVEIHARLPIPEPAGVCLWAIGAAGFGCAAGGRLRRPHCPA